MNKFIAVFCSIFIFIINLNAQSTKEFEGVITYTHKVTPIAANYYVARDYEYIGKESDFYYKSGNYKWLNKDAFMQMDMFRSKDSVEYIKMQATGDTILYANNNFANEQVTEHKILKNADTVAGHICDVLVIRAIANGNEWTRLYSFSNEFPINPALFTNYKYNSTGFIYSAMKALPLKIELIYKDRKITYTATSIRKEKLKDKFFEFSAGTKFKSLM